MNLEEKSEIMDGLFGEVVSSASVFGGGKYPQQVTILFESGKILSFLVEEDDPNKIEIVCTKGL